MRNFFLLALLLLTQGANAINDPCKQLFQKAFTQMKQASSLSDGKGLLVEYTVTTETVDDQVFQDKLSMQSFGGKTKIVSSNAIIFQDGKTMAVIQPSSEVIYLTRIGKTNAGTSSLHQLFQSQDSLLNTLIFKSCQDQRVAQGPSLKVITFDLPKELQAQTGVRVVTYSIEESTASIKEIKIQYTAAHAENSSGMKTFTLTFTRFTNDFKKKPFEGAAAENVVDSKGRLLPVYKDFSLIDKRN